MVKYYYTDALIAAYMARVFRICTEQGNKEDGSYIVNDPASFFSFLKEELPKAINSDERHKYYIHPDCHEMLKPQVGDLVKPIGGYNVETFLYINEFVEYDFEANSLGGKVPSSSYSGVDYLDSNHELPENKRVSGFEIIQRNGKAFFTPECEE